MQQMFTATCVGVGLTEGYGVVNEYLGTLSECINTFRKLAEI